MQKRILHIASIIVLTIVHVLYVIGMIFALAIGNSVIAAITAFGMLVLAVLTSYIIDEIKSHYDI